MDSKVHTDREIESLIAQKTPKMIEDDPKPSKIYGFFMDFKWNFTDFEFWLWLWVRSHVPAIPFKALSLRDPGPPVAAIPTSWSPPGRMLVPGAWSSLEFTHFLGTKPPAFYGDLLVIESEIENLETWKMIWAVSEKLGSTPNPWPF